MRNKFALERAEAKPVGRPKGSNSGPRPAKREVEVTRTRKIAEYCFNNGLSYEEYPDYRYHYWHISARINGHNCRVMAATYTERSGTRDGLAYNRIVVPKSYMNNYDFLVVVTNIEADTFYVIPTHELAPLFTGSSSLVTYYLPVTKVRGSAYDRSVVDPWKFLDRWDLLVPKEPEIQLAGKFADDNDAGPTDHKLPLEVLLLQASAYEEHCRNRGGSVQYKYLILHTDRNSAQQEIFLSGKTFTDVTTMASDAQSYLNKRGNEYRLWYITISDGRLDLLRVWNFPENMFKK